MNILTLKELKAIGRAIGWMEECLKQPIDGQTDADIAQEVEALKVAKAAKRKLNAAYKASRPKAALEAVCHTDQEMRRMQEAGTLPKNVAAWLVYCDGEPGVRPELRHHFGWCEWHSPVWVPLVYMPAAPAA